MIRTISPSICLPMSQHCRCVLWAVRFCKQIFANVTTAWFHEFEISKCRFITGEICKWNLVLSRTVLKIYISINWLVSRVIFLKCLLYFKDTPLVPLLAECRQLIMVGRPIMKTVSCGSQTFFYGIMLKMLHCSQANYLMTRNVEFLKKISFRKFDYIFYTTRVVCCRNFRQTSLGESIQLQKWYCFH
jgi:hypothetical protein